MPARPDPQACTRCKGRVLVVLGCALAVIVGMLMMAESARREADRAREAQVLIERVRTASLRVDALTWESLATSRAGRASPATIAAGLSAYRDLTSALRGLHRLGDSGGRVAEVERRLGSAYGAGLQALLMSRRDQALARHRALTVFAPAMARLDRAITDASRRQTHIARAALQRARIGSTGSLVVGLLLLLLLGWRLHRMQRSAALTEQARGVERRSEERLAALVRHSSDIVAVIDTSSRIHWIAESVERVLGYEAATLIGRHLSEFVHDEDAHRAIRFLTNAVAHERVVDRESLRLRSAGGDYRHLELLAENRLTDPLVDGILVNLRDVSQRLALEEQLRHQAFHDTLTGLANRALFEDRLARALARERRHGGKTAVIFIDLDDFKIVNDSLGHGSGDELLRGAAARLEAALRPGDTAARLGGDEFAVLVEELGGAEEASRVAERIRQALEPPFVIAGHTLTAAASIGDRLPGRPRHGRGSAPQRRRRDVRREGTRQGAGRDVRAGDAHAGTRAPRTQQRPRRRTRQRRARARLPADRGARRRHDGRRRGAAALEPSTSRPGRPATLHPPGRVQRPDHPDRALGPAHRVRATTQLAGRRSRPRATSRSASTYRPASSRTPRSPRTYGPSSKRPAYRRAD